MKRLFYIALFFIPILGVTQPNTHKIDSLERQILGAKSDTSISKLLIEQASLLFSSDSVAAIQKINQAIQLAEKTKWDKKYSLFHEIAMIYGYHGHQSKCKIYLRKAINECAASGKWLQKGIEHHSLGVNFHVENNYDSALYHYEKVIEIGKKYSFPNLIGSGYNDMGNLALYKSDLSVALDFYLKGLKVREEIKDTLAISGSINNIGLVYNHLKDYKNALKYHKKALEIAKARDDVQMKSIAYANMGGDYQSLKEYNLALDCAYEALRLRKVRGSGLEISRSYNELATTLLAMLSNNQLRKNMTKEEMLDSALMYSEKALPLAQKFGDKYGQTYILYSLGKIYHIKEEYAKAIRYYEHSAELAKELGGHLEIKQVGRDLANLKAKKGDYQSAFYWLNEFVDAKDSLYNEEKARELTRMDMQYQFEKEKAIESAIHQQELESQQAIADADKNRQLLIIVAISLGLLMVIVFSFFLYKRFKITQKQKEVIEEQKLKVETAHQELEEKNREIVDSINYAKRIQTAILPPDKMVKEYLQNSFILYKPKDIVAGDFYWMETVKSPLEGGEGDVVLFAAADCTGHGVPGAMVSVICNNGLNRSVREYNLTDPGKILDKTREIVIQEFEKSEDEVKDGMDIALCSLHNNTLQYAGANNPLWIIRNGATEIEEVKATKQPIGKYANPEPYITHTIELQKGDSIYIFTDGYADQFGGDKGKKFKGANFKKLLLSIQHESMERQKELINEAFENWRGELEQIDDVCIIGVKI